MHLVGIFNEITISELLQEALITVNRGVMGLGSVSAQKIVIIRFTRKRGIRVVKELALSGHTLQLTTEVRYLGLILNRGLTRKTKLKNVMNKTYRAL